MAAQIIGQPPNLLKNIFRNNPIQLADIHIAVEIELKAPDPGPQFQFGI